MTIASIAALFGTMFVLSVVPGPSDFAVVARSLASGFMHGMVMIAGIVLADFLFIAVAVYGLAAVAESMGETFVWVQYLCAAYLIWLGIGSMRARPSAAGEAGLQGYSPWSSFMAGFLITLGDPKAILFYMGLLPAFVDLAAVSLSQTVTIMLTATAAIVLAKTGYAFLADRARMLFNNTAARKRMDVTAGIVLLGTGVFLLVYRA